MRSRSPLAFAGVLIILLLAVLGFAAFSAVPVETTSTPDGVVLPPTVSGRIAASSLAARIAVTGTDDEAPATTVAPPVIAEQPPETTTSAPTVTEAAAPTTTTAPPATTEPPPATAEPPPATTAPTTTTTAAPTSTTAPPATTAPPPAPPPDGVAVWRPLVETYFTPDLVDGALVVIDCESGGDPNAYNPASGAAGLFQFLPETWQSASAAAGWAGASVFDPEANIAVAAWLVAGSSPPWSQWSCQP